MLDKRLCDLMDFITARCDVDIKILSNQVKNDNYVLFRECD